jgi:hypothetical protein
MVIKEEKEMQKNEEELIATREIQDQSLTIIRNIAQQRRAGK